MLIKVSTQALFNPIPYQSNIPCKTSYNCVAMNIVWISPLLVYNISSTFYTWEIIPVYLNNPIMLLKPSWAVYSRSAQLLCSFHHLSDEVYIIWIATPLLRMHYKMISPPIVRPYAKSLNVFPDCRVCATTASGHSSLILLLDSRGVVSASLSKCISVHRHPHFNSMQR